MHHKNQIIFLAALLLLSISCDNSSQQKTKIKDSRKITIEHCWVKTYGTEPKDYTVYAEFVFPHRWEKYKPIFDEYGKSSTKKNSMSKLAMLIVEDKTEGKYKNLNLQPLNDGDIRITKLSKREAKEIQSILCDVIMDTVIFRQYLKLAHEKF